MRAPVARTSSISSWCRSRSSTTTVRSFTETSLARATAARFSAGLAVMSIDVGGIGPDGELLHVDARPGIEHASRARRRR